MAVYFLCDIMDRITEIINDGALFADITELPGDDDSPASLSFSAPDPEDEFCEIDYETVDSVSEDDPCTIGDKACYAFTATELSTIHHALTNGLEYFKECLANKDGLYDRDTLDEIKSSSVSCRNLQAKVGKVLDSFK
ncbi:MAG: hypothetical protein OSJ59_16635 [Lachnospiraceae bacterium]|nr:hypothetical protein [Lachnospiraceae bacterium]